VTESDKPRLFDPERYSPASVEVMLRLPASNARAFLLASALGWFKRADGRLHGVRRVHAVADRLSSHVGAVLAADGIWADTVLEAVALGEARLADHHESEAAVRGNQHLDLFSHPSPLSRP
jgi:hypothetical protein